MKLPPVIMISCRQRSDARALTIPQLAAVGLEMHVILDECDESQARIRNGGIGLRALTLAIALNESHTLIVEDDIDLAPDFAQYLECALETPAVTYFYLNDRRERMPSIYGPELAASIRAGEPLPRRLVRARSYVGLFGTQCVLFPRAMLPLITESVVGPDPSFDGSVQRACARHSWPVVIAVPHPVQHRHDRTGRAVDERVKTSFSFHLPRLEV